MRSRRVAVPPRPRDRELRPRRRDARCLGPRADAALQRVRRQLDDRPLLRRCHGHLLAAEQAGRLELRISRGPPSQRSRRPRRLDRKRVLGGEQRHLHQGCRRPGRRGDRPRGRRHGAHARLSQRVGRNVSDWDQLHLRSVGELPDDQRRAVHRGRDQGPRVPELRRRSGCGRGLLHRGAVRRLARPLQAARRAHARGVLAPERLRRRVQSPRARRPSRSPGEHPDGHLVSRRRRHQQSRRAEPPGQRGPGRDRHAGRQLHRRRHPSLHAPRHRHEPELPRRPARRGPDLVHGPLQRMDHDRLQQPELAGHVLPLGRRQRGPVRDRRHGLPGSQPLRRRPGHVLPALDRQHGALLDRQRDVHGHERPVARELPRRRLAERQPRARRPHHDRRHRLHGALGGQRDAAPDLAPVRRRDRSRKQGLRHVTPVRDAAGLGELHLERWGSLHLLHGTQWQLRDRQPQRDRYRLQRGQPLHVRHDHPQHQRLDDGRRAHDHAHRGRAEPSLRSVGQRRRRRQRGETARARSS